MLIRFKFPTLTTSKRPGSNTLNEKSHLQTKTLLYRIKHSKANIAYIKLSLTIIPYHKRTAITQVTDIKQQHNIHKAFVTLAQKVISVRFITNLESSTN